MLEVWITEAFVGKQRIAGIARGEFAGVVASGLLTGVGLDAVAGLNHALAREALRILLAKFGLRIVIGAEFLSIELGVIEFAIRITARLSRVVFAGERVVREINARSGGRGKFELGASAESRSVVSCTGIISCTRIARIVEIEVAAWVPATTGIGIIASIVQAECVVFAFEGAAPLSNSSELVAAGGEGFAIVSDTLRNLKSPFGSLATSLSGETRAMPLAFAPASFYLSSLSAKVRGGRKCLVRRAVEMSLCVGKPVAVDNELSQR